MFHRVKIDNSNSINDLYYKRNMVVSIYNLFELIETYLQNGLKFGNIESCLKDNNFFHLSFDDGFKEHLQIAKILKQKYNIDYESITFSINVGNSYFKTYIGMDLIYLIFSKKQQSKLFEILNLKHTNDFQIIKNYIFSLTKNDILELSNKFSDLYPDLQNIFLTESEILELSKYFSIASHGETHRFLTSDIENSKNEIQHSKEVLESKINRQIDIFCYPEGKNNSVIQSFCNSASYKYAFSIKHEQENNYCIGRIIK